MDDRTFTLLEKMYSEFVNFKDAANNHFDKMDEKLDRVELRLDGLDCKVDALNARLQKVEAKIDGEVTPKLQALFDIYKANSEKLEEVSGKLDDLQVDVNNLSIKVASNDNKIIEMKRTLRSV